MICDEKLHSMTKAQSSTNWTSEFGTTAGVLVGWWLARMGDPGAKGRSDRSRFLPPATRTAHLAAWVRAGLRFGV